MRKILLIIVCAIAIAFTLWYIHLGSGIEHNCALSKIGLYYPEKFTVWGILTFIGIYGNLLHAYKTLLEKYKFQYLFCFLSAIGMILTLACDFDYSKQTEYILHCCGSLVFSVSTSICVFLLFFLNFSKSKRFAVFTYIIGTILIADLICLLIFKENALIETVPVIFALIILPLLNFTDLFKEKAYASR